MLQALVIRFEFVKPEERMKKTSDSRPGIRIHLFQVRQKVVVVCHSNEVELIGT